MNTQPLSKIEQLMDKGVRIPSPHSIEIGDDVDIHRISGNGVVIHSGCKIYGNSTLILQNTKIGYESPVTLENCQVGPEVHLKGGFFKQAVFLKKVSMGYGAHVREGTILEEEASVAHTVGIKQTILFPFVTLGSLINFCDCLMAGGTSRKNHSEVGSSYIHFNFTPNQDKATPSLIGDVPCGVMLNQSPIFLGGQGGLVGPTRLAFGTVIAAGSIYRKDELRPGRLIFEGSDKSGNIPVTTGIYLNIKRTVTNNIVYIANLIALMSWYRHVRSLFISDDFPQALHNGLIDRLNQAIDERIKRLKELALKMPESIECYKQYVQENNTNPILQQQSELYTKWREADAFFRSKITYDGNTAIRERFLENIHAGIKTSGKDYISVIQRLTKNSTQTGTQWLVGIVDDINNEVIKIIPSFRRIIGTNKE